MVTTRRTSTRLTEQPNERPSFAEIESEGDVSDSDTIVGGEYKARHVVDSDEEEEGNYELGAEEDEPTPEEPEEEDEVGRGKRRKIATSPKKRKTTSSPTKNKTSPAKKARSSPKRSKNAKASTSTAVSSNVPLPFTQTAAFKKLSTFEKAKTVLHVSATPGCLPCRDEQKGKIASLLEQAILDQTGTCLYIHGVPGTGKTATVHSVIRELKADKDMEAFQFVEINGMKIAEPNAAFTALWEALSGRKVSPRQAVSALEDHFQTEDPDRQMTVVLVDELDQMITKKQDVVYNFFNWPHLPHSRLVVLAVANTMDLPERELSGKIRSRLGSNRIPFPTYSWQELEKILNARLEGIKAFVDPSLTRISKSVAAVSGDARRALDVARRTVEKKEQSNLLSGKEGALCTMTDVHETYKEMSSFGVNAFVRESSFHAKVLLLAVSQCARRAGVAEVELDKVIKWHLDFLRQTALALPPTHEELFEIVAELHAARLVTTETQRLDYFQRVRACVGDSDLFEVLRGEQMLRSHVPKFVAA